MKRWREGAQRCWTRTSALGLLLSAMSAQAALTTQGVPKTEANVPIEITFQAREDVPDPFNQITLDVVFIDPTGHSMRVPGFWDGGRVWKVRYASPVLGVHQYRCECRGSPTFGLDGLTGKVEVHKYRGHNPLFKRGPVRV